jgi:hypothetical protein
MLVVVNKGHIDWDVDVVVEDGQIGGGTATPWIKDNEYTLTAATQIECDDSGWKMSAPARRMLTNAV